MTGKFALFFLVAVCLVQGYQSRVAEPRGLIDDAINAIKKIIKNIQDAISEITNKLSDIIKNLEEKIKEIISNIHIDEIIQSIQDKIQEAIDHILELAGLDPKTVRDCLETEKKAVEKLSEETAAAIGVCTQTAEDEVAKLTKEMEELKNRAAKLIQDSTGSIKQCFDEHGIHIVQVVKCLNEHSEELKADADALIKQIKTTIAVANDKLIKVPIALSKCVAQVNADALQKQKVIIEEFKTCVDSHKQETTEPAKPTKPTDAPTDPPNPDE